MQDEHALTPAQRELELALKSVTPTAARVDSAAAVGAAPGAVLAVRGLCPVTRRRGELAGAGPAHRGSPERSFRTDGR